MSGVMNLSFNDYIDIASCPLVPCTFNQKCPRNDACGIRECCPSLDVNFIQSENEVRNSENDCISVGWTTCALKLFCYCLHDSITSLSIDASQSI